MRWRHLPFYIVLIVSSWLLVVRLFELTIIRGKYFRQLSEGNRIQEKVVRSPRGIIYDRKGQVLARNIPTYKKCPAPSFEQKSPDEAAEGVKCQILTREEALEIEVKPVPGTLLEVDLGREYPWGGLLSHVLGYTGEVGKDEVREKICEKEKEYKIGDSIGRSGVEEQYECFLRGVDGKELVEVDALGRKIRTLGRIDPKPGQDLTLALDLDLQKVVAQALGELVGAVVVSDPNSGEILALFSSPSFDPNLFTEVPTGFHFGSGTVATPPVEKILTDPQRPMFNRVVSGLYPPGSTFKIVTAATGIETGKIDKETRIEDVGQITIGPFRFPNWYFIQYGRKEGLLDIVGAIKRSNDTFFYKVGEWVGIKDLAKWAEKLGVGKVLGIDLPSEAAGVMPTPEWREKVRGESWFLGDTYHVAIGQGDLEVTPLQVNFWTGVIANGGKLCKPRILKIEDRRLRIEDTCKDVGLKKETIDLIKEGMRQACSSGGTGWPLFNFEIRNPKSEIRKIETACKTGTAEFGDPKDRTHAWFTVFAPVSASDSGNQYIKTDQIMPEIVVTVLVEGGGEGSNVAAPIAKEILEEWFGR